MNVTVTATVPAMKPPLPAMDSMADGQQLQPAESPSPRPEPWASGGNAGSRQWRGEPVARGVPAAERLIVALQARRQQPQLPLEGRQVVVIRIAGDTLPVDVDHGRTSDGKPSSSPVQSDIGTAKNPLDRSVTTLK